MSASPVTPDQLELPSYNRHAHASRPAAAIRDPERDASLLIEHLIDEALDVSCVIVYVSYAFPSPTSKDSMPLARVDLHPKLLPYPTPPSSDDFA